MIIMYLKLDNFYAFKNFELSMSYPKKTIKSPIDDEFLPAYPNFRYKKVNIIFGSNATGKTTLGKAIMNILNFISHKTTSALEKSILDANKTASFCIDYIVDEPKLNRIILNIVPQAEGKKRYDFSYDCEKIKSRDSYQTCVARLEEKGRTLSDYNTTLDTLEPLSWMFSYPESRLYTLNNIKQEIQLKALKAILMALDPSIKNVELLNGVKDTSFIIDKDNREILLQNGILTDPDIFSSGTRDGINISAIMAGIMEHNYKFYYCDEQFSYISSSIEKRILGIMISKLLPGEQLFFTTHNETIMEENYPKHSFIFLIREDNQIKAKYANDYVQKPTDNLRRAVENDVIRMIPDDSSLDILED